MADHVHNTLLHNRTRSKNTFLADHIITDYFKTYLFIGYYFNKKGVILALKQGLPTFLRSRAT